MVPPEGTALEMAGGAPLGSGAVAPRRTGYELFDPDDRMPPEARRSRGGVSTATNAPNESGAAERREIVTRGWAGGGKAYFESNTGHTESQFENFLVQQGPAFRQRIVAIEIHSTLSPCSGCTDILRHIRKLLDGDRAPQNPANPSGPKVGTAVLTFAYQKLYQPPENFNIPNAQAAQTTPADLDNLRKARWIVTS
jgi:hypothetical protein